MILKYKRLACVDEFTILNIKVLSENLLLNPSSFNGKSSLMRIPLQIHEKSAKMYVGTWHRRLGNKFSRAAKRLSKSRRKLPEAGFRKIFRISYYLIEVNRKFHFNFLQKKVRSRSEIKKISFSCLNPF
jgi:hypothetical protein